MQKQRTLTELRCLADETFAEAHATIDTARQIASNCRRLTGDLRRSREELRQLIGYSYGQAERTALIVSSGG